MYTVGKLAKKFGLSRSTLLHYDYIGLLRPAEHSKGSYRYYTEEEAGKLGRICALRKAGVSLKEIAKLLESQSSSEVSSVLELRLKELADDMESLRRQQQIVAALLQTCSEEDSQGMDKDKWSRLFEDAGFNVEQMHRWHKDFERMSPDKHTRFLQFLKIPENEIRKLRAWAAAPHEIWNLQKDSEQFMLEFFRIYENVPRKGPGSFENTRRALEMCAGLPDHPEILDIGCGNGADAIDLAKLTGSHVQAVDIYAPYLDEVESNAAQAGLKDLITTRQGDMSGLDYPPESFDLLWSEGAAYIMGFDNALAAWKKFLKPGGYLVLSEATWLVDPETGKIPEELLAFWKEAYPAMRTSEGNRKAIKKAGYTLKGNFFIPRKDWDTFYNGLEEHLRRLPAEYASTGCGPAIVELSHREISLHRKYPDCYGYEFYIMRKP